jgi:hypothetical protein
LKLSTTLAMFGYQAHTETAGASVFRILLVQFDGVTAALLVPPLPPSPPPPPPGTGRG